MNVNSGGPHLLLFERDQQLTALLTSEFQLAGYECHAARTAVEVFDAIARYPIRLVLVNLAQAAAGRREFWVALDAQRRGRGVQVFTFRCMNVAGYGADDPDDRARTVLADMEVDGMLGVMNLVDAVRSRVPGSTTGSMSRIPVASAAPRQVGMQEAPSAPVSQPVAAPSPSITGQATSPLPTLASDAFAPPSMPSAPSSSSSTTVTFSPPPRQQVAEPAVPVTSMPTKPDIIPSTPSTPAVPPLATRSAKSTSGFTDKILAVIYPTSRNVPQMPVEQQTGGSQINAHLEAPQARSVQNQLPPNSSGNESGLEQLSRLIREQDALPQEEEVRRRQQIQSSGMQRTQSGAQVTQNQPASPPISAMSLRASPIQDIDIERVNGGPASGGTSRQIGSQEAESSQQPRRSDIPPRPSPSESVPPSPPTAAPMAPKAPTTVVVPTVTPDISAMSSPAQTPISKPSPAAVSISLQTAVPVPAEPQNKDIEQEKTVASSSFPDNKLVDEVAEEDAVMEQVQTSVPGGILRKSETGTSTASDDATLLSIVQSFPPITSQPQQVEQAQRSQPLVLSGRATRSLGSVLLEGHLVPQHRLEVAQHIQRVLRGVDMNYQLGEILLMFKLLTPDQLLAASLVSYGLISTVQISALGHIRQELHSIGLEYDLESLLVLFRILSPEQLREVRASWSG